MHGIRAMTQPSEQALADMSASLMAMLIGGPAAAASAAPPPPELVETQGDEESSLQSRIRVQVEFYFGDKNYRRDRFLRSKEDGAGFIPLSVLMGFAKLTSLSKDPDVVFDALRRSPHLLLRYGLNRAICRAEPLAEEPVDQRPLPERVAEVCTEFDVMWKEHQEGSSIASLGMRPLRQLAGLAAWAWRGNEPYNLAKICTPPLMASTGIALTLTCAEESSVLCHEYLQIIDRFIARSFQEALRHDLATRAMADAFNGGLRAAREHLARLKKHEKDAGNAARKPLSRAQSDAFSAEIVRVVQRLAPLDDETQRMKENVRASLEQLLRGIAPGWRTCEVKTYGSTNSTLGFQSSDVDCCVCIDPAIDVDDERRTLFDQYGGALLDEEEEEEEAERRFDAEGNPIPLSFEVVIIKAARRAMKTCVDAAGNPVWSDVKAITTARIPILNTVHAASGVELDLCVNQLLPLHNTSLLKA